MARFAAQNARFWNILANFTVNSMFPGLVRALPIRILFEQPACRSQDYKIENHYGNIGK